MDTFPAQHDLLGFFECEPALADAGIPWAYNCLRFDTTRSADRVVCEIEPGYEVVRLAWEREGAELVRLELNGVRGLAVHAEGGCEALVGTFRDPAVEPFRLQLRPSVHLRWGTVVRPEASPSRAV
jgi:hypothetical protein